MANSDALERLLEKMETTFNSRFDNLDKNVTEVREKNEELARKIYKPRDFVRKGNKHQFEFNSTVNDSLEEVQSALTKGNSGKAHDKATEGLDLVKQRQKLILMADSTSWDVVREYEGPEVAENSDDEGKIRRALATVERKKRNAPGRGGRRGRGRWQQSDRSSYRNENYRNNSSFRDGRRSPQRNYDNRESYQHAYNKSKSGNCHNCGGYGHWAAECASKNRSNDNRRGKN
jgi:hypothetical protein